MTQLCLQHQGYDYVINNEQLQIQRAGTILAQFSLAPLIEGKATELGPWREIDGAHLCADLDQGGAVHLAIRDGYVCYWMETAQQRLESLTYFPSSAATGNDGAGRPAAGCYQVKDGGTAVLDDLPGSASVL